MKTENLNGQTRQPYELAAYYFPQWHFDPQNEAVKGKGWTEWESLKKAVPRFYGHEQPKIPFWGYIDEADPKVSEKQINAAADHGIGTFLYDWYWDLGPKTTGEGYEGDAAKDGETGPFLQRALEEGFLHAKNRNQIKFALMWANHRPIKRERFNTMTDYIIDNYLHENNYWKVNGGLYFSIYELWTFVNGLGGVIETLEALDFFRKKVINAGLPPLHINVMEWGLDQIDGYNRAELVEFLGIDSLTSYVWLHDMPGTGFPAVDYADYAKGAPKMWDELTKRNPGVVYFPNVTMGWDPSPRVPADQPYEEGPYPNTFILVNNKPEIFENSLKQAKQFIDDYNINPRIITIYAWNEWTEGGYLEPDNIHGMKYLEAIRNVFNGIKNETDRMKLSYNKNL